MNELFKMNDHGDIWQEPTLFDQGADVAPIPTAEEHALGAVDLVEVEPGMAWTASARCSCGELVTGRCCSAVSARQWLATEHHRHRNADRHPFEVVGLF